MRFIVEDSRAFFVNRHSIPSPLSHRSAGCLRSSFMAGFRLTSSSHNVNLWIVPLKMSLAAAALFAITITPDMLAAYHVIHIPDWFTMGGIDDARAILSAMLRCVSTVLALIFSVALHSATQRRCWTALPGVLPRRT